MVSGRNACFGFFAVLSSVCSVHVRTRLEGREFESKNFTVRDVSAVVINLASRPDRYEQFLRSRKEIAPWLTVFRIDAVDGAKNPPSTADVTIKWDNSHVVAALHGSNPGIQEMSAGERGCAASHVKAWRHAAGMAHPLIVFEDDAELLTMFEEGLSKAMSEAPADTDLISLVAADRQKDLRTPFSETLMKPYMMLRTNGYILYPAGAQKLLRMLPVNAPSDDFLAWLIRKGDLKGFSTKYALVNSEHDGGDIDHSMHGF